MANQYLAICEETARGTKPGAPTWRFLPLIEGLAPKFAPKDEPRKEFRGQDTALGDASLYRKESQFTVAPKFYLYPGAEVGLLLKHLLGFAGNRSVVDTSAYTGILYPLTMPYGAGANLADKAVGYCPNIDRDGVTASQYFGGSRYKSLTLNIPANDDITISMEGQGAGPWVAAANQAAVAGASFPLDTLTYHGTMAAFYIGTGATRTGTAPDYTNLAPGSMVQFYPDDFELKITNGLDDVVTGNGVKGPSKTERTGQFSVEASFGIDFRDPASGFSSIDEFEAIYSGVRTNSLMVVLTHTALAGAATQVYKEVIDIPLVSVSCDTPEPSNEGKQVKAKFSCKSLAPSGNLKPLHWLRIDKSSAY